jgi:uncharacterized membrane protein YhaH (DUF805 family)
MSNKNGNPNKYWFRAKRYGWGWGLPISWQGWVVFIAYIGSVIAVSFVFPPERHKALFICFIVLLSMIFIILCWVKGEPTKWRWGKDKDTQ